MKKILILFLFVINIKTYALSNIKVNNEDLSPSFDKNIKVYNYYTMKDNISISATSKNNEVITGLGNYNVEDKMEISITSSIDGNYTIRVFKDYIGEDEIYLKNLIIENYNINYDRNIHEYSININDEKELNINYELSNSNGYLSINGNGNFNNKNNIITINVNNNEEYIINVYKDIENKIVSKETKEELPIKKEIIILLIIIISCTLIFLFSYITFY